VKHTLKLLQESDDFEILEIKNGFNNDHWKKDPSKYADVKVILRTKTLPFQELVEFQLIMEQSMLLKMLEHKT